MKEKSTTEGLWERRNEGEIDFYSHWERRNEGEIDFYRRRKRCEWSKVIRSD